MRPALAEQNYSRGMGCIRLEDAFDHEQVEVFRDHGSGLTGVIAIHSTVLGPAMGGLRISRYGDLEEQMVDACRLSYAMTLKNASAGLDLGGGKAVLLDDGRWSEHRHERLVAVARTLNQLEGRYITAEDVGTTPDDMDLMGIHSRWVAGRSRASGGRGDPSPATARTVLGAITAAVEVADGRTGLQGVRVGVLGVGSVGARLATLLADAGAELVVADIAGERAAEVAAATGAAVTLPDTLMVADVDVLAPCGLGEVIAAATVPALRCRVVAGAANNPLTDDAAAVALHSAGILYVPDFLANSGGIIYVGAEALEICQARVESALDASMATTAALLAEAASHGVMPLALARERATSRILSARMAATAS